MHAEAREMVARAPDLVTRCIAGETIIVPVRNSVARIDSIFTINAIGSRIWSLIDGTLSVDQLGAMIAGEYAVDETQARADVAEFLAVLAQHGLVVSGPQGKG